MRNVWVKLCHFVYNLKINFKHATVAADKAKIPSGRAVYSQLSSELRPSSLTPPRRTSASSGEPTAPSVGRKI